MIRTVLGLMVAASLAGAMAFLLLARDIYIVESGSMSPTLHPGDAVVVKSLDGPVHPGQVIAFEVQDKLITHRVTRVEAEGIHVKGDALDEEDPWTIPPAAVRGEVDFRVPYAGYLVIFLRQPAGWLSLVVLPALLLFAAEVRRVSRRRPLAKHTHPAGRSTHKLTPPSVQRPSAPGKGMLLIAALLAALATLALAAAFHDSRVPTVTKRQRRVGSTARAVKMPHGRRDASHRTASPVGEAPLSPRPPALRRWATLLALFAVLAAAAVAAGLHWHPVLGFVSGTRDESLVITTGPFGPSPAAVEIHPHTLNLKSHGRWLTAYVELPEGLDVDGIDVATVRLCLGQPAACPEVASVPAAAHPTAVGDHDGDTIPDRMLKFDRPGLVQLLAGRTGDVAMTVSGLVAPPGQPFAGSDAIRVIDRGCGGDGDGLCEDGETSETGPPPEATVPLETAVPPEATPSPEATPPPETAPPAQPDIATLDHRAEPADTLVPNVPTIEYVVRPGERLWDVAAFFGTTVDLLVTLNGLSDPNLVVPGQRLLVPAPPVEAGATAPAFTTEYVVQPGDTLTDIAARFGTAVEALAAANNLANPSAIRIGDRLLVP